MRKKNICNHDSLNKYWNIDNKKNKTFRLSFSNLFDEQSEETAINETVDDRRIIKHKTIINIIIDKRKYIKKCFLNNVKIHQRKLVSVHAIRRVQGKSRCV